MTPLHVFGEWLRNLLLQIPLPAVRVLFVLVLLSLIVWVLTLPRSETTSPDRPYRFTANLKLWAVLALMIQVAIYVFL